MKPIEATAHLLEFEGKSPAGTAKRLIRFPLNGILRHFERICNSSMLDEAWWVPDVCIEPSGIWCGLDRMNQEEAFCYSGVPSGGISEQFGGPEIEFPPGQVLLVFLTPMLEVTKWRKCTEDPNRNGFPVGHETRFGERKWPSV